MKKLGLIALIPLMMSSAVYAEETSDWYITGSLGYAFNKSEDVYITDTGGDILIKDANIESKPFDAPPYYAIKLGHKLSGDYEGYSVEFEHVHHKIYIDDLPAGVDHFEVTDGYNLFYLNARKSMDDGYGIRLGVGAVVAHPQITVRDTETYVKGGGAIPAGEGYQMAGWSFQAAVDKEIEFAQNWVAVPEIKLTHSRANIDLENGDVDLDNTALHLQLGVQYKF